MLLLLLNILLIDLDCELEWCRLDFCWYVDDCNIYVWSEWVGLCIMVGVMKFLWEWLKFIVNVVKIFG